MDLEPKSSILRLLRFSHEVCSRRRRAKHEQEDLINQVDLSQLSISLRRIISSKAYFPCHVERSETSRTGILRPTVSLKGCPKGQNDLLNV